jgi:hypothetical protein
MAGILANSASVTMASGTPDNSQAGYVVGEQVVLTATPTGTTYAWAQSIPSGSAPARSVLSDAAVAAPRFIPDVAGVYTLVCTVDSTTVYVLRISVTLAASASVAQALRFSPVPDASVAAPALGRVLYFSSDQNALVVKDPDDNLFTVDLTPVP